MEDGCVRQQDKRDEYVDVTEIQEVSQRLMTNVSRVIVGKPEAIRLAIIALLCEGHILAGRRSRVGKTMLARALAGSLGCSFSRLQFTPDLLPSDVTGVSVFNQKTQEFEFRPDRSCLKWCWPMRSTELHLELNPLCWSAWKKGK